LPCELVPTTVADLFDDFITALDMGKLRLDASKHALASRGDVMLPQTLSIRAVEETLSIRAVEASTDRPVPLPPSPPAVSSYAAVIPAPVAAA